MAMYSSKSDPEPWLRTEESLGYMRRFSYRFSGDEHSEYRMHYMPRPETARNQNNPTNPILARFREKEPGIQRVITERLGVGYPAEYWAYRLGQGQPPSGVEASEAEIAHAHRVLTRLVAFRDHEKPNRT